MGYCGAVTTAPGLPRRLGGSSMGKRSSNGSWATGLAMEDLIATATALTAAAVAEGMDRFVRPRMKVDELIVSGGGVHNPVMMGFLAALIPDVALATSSDFSVAIDPDREGGHRLRAAGLRNLGGAGPPTCPAPPVRAAR